MRSGNGSTATLERFVEQWQRLRSASAQPGTVVLVEGERDRRAVRRLGLPGAVETLHAGRSLSETAHALVQHGRRIVVLTDWDNEGGHLAHRIGDFLKAERLELDLDTRRRLALILRGELVHVEGLYGWARRLAESAGESIEQRLDDGDESPTG
jgi:5S rRNA maturation endonuclease (ribonuclease M5)